MQITRGISFDKKVLWTFELKKVNCNGSRTYKIIELSIINELLRKKWKFKENCKIFANFELKTLKILKTPVILKNFVTNLIKKIDKKLTRRNCNFQCFYNCRNHFDNFDNFASPRIPKLKFCSSLIVLKLICL